MKIVGVRTVLDFASKRAASIRESALLKKIRSRRKARLLNGRLGWYWALREQFAAAERAFDAIEKYGAEGRPDILPLFSMLKKDIDFYSAKFESAVASGESRMPSDGRRGMRFRSLSGYAADLGRCSLSIFDKMKLFGMSGEAALASLAKDQRLGIHELDAALSNWSGRPRPASACLIGGKKLFLHVRSGAVEGRARSGQKENAVGQMKFAAVFDLFNEGADLGMQAADLIGDIIVQNYD